VDAGGLSPNTWKRLERLSLAWGQAKRGIGSHLPHVLEPELGVVSKPTRRCRTPLTASEVDAIQTVKASGEGTVSIAERFDIHRMTVWERPKDLNWIHL